MRRDGKPWTDQEVAELRRLAAAKKDARAIAVKMRRTTKAISARAVKERISLDPRRTSPSQ